ncbi:MAG: hypothetical protein ABJA37_07885 [Ferruginibacter sp.]
MADSLGLAYSKKDWSFDIKASLKTAHDYQNRIDRYVYGTAFRELNISAKAALDKSWGSIYLVGTLKDNQQEIPDGSRDSLARQFTKQVLEKGDDIKNQPLVSSNEMRYSGISPLHQHIHHYRLYSKGNFKLGDSNISAMFGVQQSIRRELNHPEQPAQPGLYVILNTLNYDVKYSFPTWKGLETTAGVNGMYQSNRNSRATDFFRYRIITCLMLEVTCLHISLLIDGIFPVESGMIPERYFGVTFM